MGCHGNHALRTLPKQIYFRTTLSRIYGVLINNLAPLEIVLGAMLPNLDSGVQGIYHFLICALN